MRHLVLLLLLLCSFLPATFAQNSEDCIDAHILAPTATLLSDIADVTIDEVIGSGNEPAEWFMDSEGQCGPERTFIAREIDKSYWFVFSAETSGELEFMITPEAPGTTYDFALWKGGCPNDFNCSELFYCAWGVGAFDCSFSPTGVTPDPQTNFNIPPTPNLAIYEETIQLNAGENYYLLVQNTDESNNPICSVPSDSLGFKIEFGGTAIIGPEIIHQAPTALQPTPNTAILTQCPGDQVTFAVSQVPNASTYDWVSESTINDAIITPNALGDSATVTFGTTSGQICMELICPIQSIICWEVQVEQVPDLTVIPNPVASCEPVDLAIRFQDDNNTNGTLAYYETAEDARNEVNPLASSIVNIEGNYWARKNTSTGCSDIIQMTILVDNIAISIQDTFSVCNQNFVNLRDELPIQSLNGNTGDLLFVFYEDSLDAVNRTNPFTPPVAFASGTYWVRAEKQAGGLCFDVKSFELVFDTTPEIAPIPTQELCNSTCFQLLDLPLNTPAGNPLSNLGVAFYDNEAAALVGNIEDTIDTEICSDGTYWVRAASSPSCFAVESFQLNFSAAPDIDDLTLMLDCNFGSVNLSELRLTEKNGINETDLSYRFFRTEMEATDPNTTPLTLEELLISSPIEIWINVTNQQNGCFDIAKVSITGMPLATATLTGDQEICAGGAGALDINFTGDGPFTITYTDGVGFFDTTATTNNFLLLVSPNSTRTYSIFSFMDNNGCVGNAEGTARVAVNDSPIINNLMESCNADNTTYTLSFEIIGNDTYTVRGVTGTLTGNMFTSDPIPSGNAFILEIVGTNGCPSTTQAINFFSCACNAVVDIMDTQPINVCDRAAAIGTYLGPGGENLDNGTRFFVLHDSPTTTLGNVIAYEEVPIFTFDDATMEHGVTYYLSAIITRTDLLGEPILDLVNNSCLVTSIGAPVTFYAIPEANLSLSTTTICQGESANLTFNINGVGPFDVIFFDGAGLRPLMDIPDGHTISVMPTFSTNFYIESVSQSGINDCESMPLSANNEIDITVFEVPIIQNVTTSCNEEGTRLVLSFEVIGGDLATYMVDGMNGTFKGNEFTSDTIPHNTPYNISITDVNNCPTIPVMGVAECYCTPDIGVEISTVKVISCRGEKDAVLSATPINGAAPYTYFWSTGSTAQSVNSIAPGITAVSVTDANGCLVMDTVNLIEPTSITSSVNTLDPSCFEENDGTILFVQVEGGTGEYSYSFNNSPFRVEGQRDGLVAGVYPVGIQDENGCQWTGEVTLNNPPQLDVSLGDNKALNLGDSITLNPQINDTEITLEWESEDATICLDCPNPTVKPTTSQRYKVTVVNDAGCVASAQVLVQVQNQQRLFIPSAFSPNGDGTNDILHPFMGSEIQGIPMFRVFNRWGELVFEDTDMAQSPSLDGWDGTTLTGKKAPPGVYIFYAEINFRNGTTDMQTGDVTLIR